MQKVWAPLCIIVLVGCAKTPIADSAPPPGLPDPTTLARLPLWPGCSMSEAEARAVLGRARLLVIPDPLKDGWSYSPNCSGTAEYASGSYSVTFFLGGRGRLTSPGRNLLFEYAP